MKPLIFKLLNLWKINLNKVWKNKFRNGLKKKLYIENNIKKVSTRLALICKTGYSKIWIKKIKI